MGNSKELNIKNRTYFYFDDIIDIRNFHSNLLKIDKKSYRGFDIYFIGYNTIKKLSNCNCDCDYENIRSVNSFYLIIHSATEYFKEKYDEKCLILDSTEYKNKSFLELNQKLKELMVEKNYFINRLC